MLTNFPLGSRGHHSESLRSAKLGLLHGGKKEGAQVRAPTASARRKPGNTCTGCIPGRGECDRGPLLGMVPAGEVAR